MASLIPGFEYDVFISYRQKDNKHDGWVTQFVNNLKGELESTFKEEIGVYFDTNPYDGLLETHDVEASLREKLKCLVFIPVISRTYCDPKSFAWEREFKAFVELASLDQFGLKIKLSNGNVANRVLPVRIHDLDSADTKLCESILGGVLRGVDFIYREPGVNRPLTPLDEDETRLNNPRYRNQINKLANTISDIVSGITTSYNIQPQADISVINQPAGRSSFAESLTEKISKKKKTELLDFKSTKTPSEAGKIKAIALSSLTIFAIVVILMLFYSGSSLPFSKRDWTLITDFENLTQNNVFDKSLYTAFSLTASQSRYINVFPRSRMIETMNRMKIQNLEMVDEKRGREIALREGINLFIVPGISKAGNSYSLTAKIVETRSGNTLKSEVFYAESEDGILSELDRLSRKVRRDLGESLYGIAMQAKPLKKVTTRSLEALKLYSLGIDQHLNLDFEGAKNYYAQALIADTGFTSARASLGNINIEKFDPVEGQKLLSQAIKSVDNLTDREKLGILAFYSVNVEKNIPKGIEYTSMRIELYPDDAIAHNNLGWYYQKEGDYERAASEYKKAIRIDNNMALTYGGIIMIYLDKLVNIDSAMVWSEKLINENPQNPWGFFYMGSAYICLDSLERAENCFRKSRDISPDIFFNLYRLAHSCRLQGHYSEAILILRNILEINKNEASAYYDLGVNYEAMGNPEESRKNFCIFKKIGTDQWLIKYPGMAKTYLALAAVSARLGEMDYSDQMLQKAVTIDSSMHFSFAEIFCLQDKIPEALIQLDHALSYGYRDLCWLKMDPDLQPLKYDIRFHKLLDKYFSEKSRRN